MSVAMDVPVQSWSPTQQLEAAARDKPVKLVLIHEEWMYRAHKYLDKNSTENRDLAKRLIESGKWEVQSESALEVQLVEAKRKPVCYVFEYEGPFGTINDYIRGKSAYINEVLTELVPAHQRTWIMGEPQQGTYLAGPDSGPQLRLEMNMDDVIRKLKESEPDRFSEYRKVTWEQVQRLDEDAKEAMRVNKQHPESELPVGKAK